ncbi:hypothetical protein [Aurantiacibacter marinus]|nr:hypothetical protein [Aurantiacibacter marinus]
MTRFASNTFAALVAVVITASSLTAITQVPDQRQMAIAAAPLLA